MKKFYFLAALFFTLTVSVNAQPKFGTPTVFQKTINEIISKIPINIAGNQVNISFEGDSWRGKLNGQDLLAGIFKIDEGPDGSIITIKQSWLFADTGKKVPITNKPIASWVDTPGPELFFQYIKGPPVSLLPISQEAAAAALAALGISGTVTDGVTAASATQTTTDAVTAAPATQTTIPQQTAKSTAPALDPNKLYFSFSVEPSGFIAGGPSATAEFSKGALITSFHASFPTLALNSTAEGFGFGAGASLNYYWGGPIGGFFLGGVFEWNMYPSSRTVINPYGTYNITTDSYSSAGERVEAKAHNFIFALEGGYKFVLKNGIYFRTGIAAGVSMSQNTSMGFYYKPDLATGYIF
jgi:hypothetical protein